MRCGDSSLHPQWIDGPPEERNFDLLVSYFGNNETVAHRFIKQAEYFENRPGRKWHELREIFVSRPELLENYRAFWLPDDDLSIQQEGKCCSDVSPF